MKVLGHGEALKHTDNGRVDVTYSGAAWSGPRAFAEAGVDARRHRLRVDLRLVHHHRPRVPRRSRLLREGARAAHFVLDGALVAPDGRLPFNTDGGGLCNNHPGNRGGMTKIIEAVRQLRGEAHPAVQVPTAARPGARYRRLARHPHGQRHARARTGGRVTTRTGDDERTPADPRSLGHVRDRRSGTATADGTLLLPRCDDCDTVIWYPRAFCPACGSLEVAWIPASGQRHRLQLHDHPARRRAVRRLGPTSWPTSSWRKGPAC